MNWNRAPFIRSDGNRRRTTRIRAVAASLMRSASLPPGSFSRELDEIERNDRRSLLQLSRCEGPVFKGQAWNDIWVYVVGLQRSRRILQDFESFLQPVTIDTHSLFPKGLLRQMQGETHRHYRRALVEAFKSSSIANGCIGDLCDAQFRDLAAEGVALRREADAFRNLLSEIALKELMVSVLGVEPETPLYDALSLEFEELGGNGLVWNIGLRQQRAFGRIEKLLSGGKVESSSLLERLKNAGHLDQAMLGNLIYMVEMGRYDLAAFFRWLTWFCSLRPKDLELMSAESDQTGSYARAFVQEALRLEQSERLVRHVKKDFVAEGYLFPKGFKVRFCLWESHKLDESFEDPWNFDANRFVAERPARDRFAPFGLDAHQCPFGTYTITLGAAFVSALSRYFRLQAPAIESPVRGLYHWEPPPSFSPVLEPRSQASFVPRGRHDAD